MKIRVYYKNNKIISYEHDPSEEYTDDRHPGKYIKSVITDDKGNETRTYENVPEWFVMDSTDLPDGAIEDMVTDGTTVTLDQAAIDARQAEKDQEEAEENAALDALDPALRKILKKLLRKQ